MGGGWDRERLYVRIVAIFIDVNIDLKLLDLIATDSSKWVGVGRECCFYFYHCV